MTIQELNHETFAMYGIELIGKHEFKLNIPNLGKFEVFDIPAHYLTPHQWSLIMECRESYATVWGAGETLPEIIKDDFDGLENDSPYNTRHQLAKFTSLTDGSIKYLTNRRVIIKPHTKATLPDDISFWQLVDIKSGLKVATLENLLDGSSVEAISRTGITPQQRKKDGLDRDSTAIAWALMQVAVTYHNKSDYIVCQLLKEFPEKIHNIEFPKGNFTKLNFTPSVDTLRIPKGLALKLDRKNPYVIETILSYPGYWLDTTSLRSLFLSLQKNNDLRLEDLDIENFSVKSLNDPNIRNLFNYPDIREKIVNEVAERPFSSTLIPSEWQKSALDLIAAGKTKYS